jgi:hypothetical protein
LKEDKMTDQCELMEFLPERGLAVIFGKPASGKSFLALDLAMRAAADRGRVLYCTQDGARGVKKRVNAYFQERAAHGRESNRESFRLMPGQPFRNAAERERLILSMRAVVAGSQPAMVVIDQLPADTFNAVEFIEAVDAAFDCLVLAVQNVRGDTGATREHLELAALADVVICVDRDEQGRVVATPAAPGATSFAYTLRVVELAGRHGEDRVTSCVLDPEPRQ